MRLAKTVLLFTLMSAAVWAQVNVRRTEARSQPALHHDAGDHLYVCPGGWPSCPTAACWSPKRSGPSGWCPQQGQKISPVANTPPVYWQGQNGMLGVFVSPRYATDQSIYLTYAEPGDYGGGLALARAQAEYHRHRGETGKPRGAVAPAAQGQGRPGRRARSPSRPTASICSSRLATASASRRPRIRISPPARSCA